MTRLDYLCTPPAKASPGRSKPGPFFVQMLFVILFSFGLHSTLSAQETEGCALGETELVVTINTDFFGGGAGFELRNSLGLLVDSGNALPNATFVKSICLPDCADNYSFVVFSDFEGEPEGAPGSEDIEFGTNYTLELAGNQIAGGFVDGSETTNFSIAADVDCNPPVVCSSDEVKLTFTLNADDFGGETTFELQDAEGEIILEGGSFLSNTTTVVETCLTQCSGAYAFTISDSFGDGICCDYGMGSYTLELDNELIASGGDFGASETTNFQLNAPTNGGSCGFDLNVLGCEGDASYNEATQTYTLEATNCIYANSYMEDEIVFLAGSLCGDGEIITQVTNIDPFAWAGIMLRETTAQGSKKVSLARDNGYFARREARTTTNGPAYPQQFPAFGKNWLRLVRQGSAIIGYVSPNGSYWQQVMAVYVDFDECISAGVFLTNKQFNQTVTADFRNLQINEAGGGSGLQQLVDTNPMAAIGDLNVYPNPTAGLLTVDLGAMLDKEVQLELRNTNGQLVRQLDLGQVSERRTELQLGDLPVGIYWLRVQAAGEAPITERIMIYR